MRKSLEDIEKQTILDTDPAVSVDIEVGHHLPMNDSVYVDMEALRKTLKATGAPEDNSDLSITLKHKIETEGYNSEDHTTRGTYDYDTTDAQLLLDRFDPSGVQESLQHELHHYADFITNPPSAKELAEREFARKSKEEQEEVAKKRARKITYGLGSVGLGYIGFNTSVGQEALVPSVLSNETYEAVNSALSTGSHYALGAAAVIAVGTKLLGPKISDKLGQKISYKIYRTDKRERSAREAEKMNLPHVVRFDQEWTTDTLPRKD